MPMPGSSETEDEFIARCMSDDEAMADFPDEDQRYAICVSKWEGKADGHSPTEAMAREATRGLEWRAEYNRGGTEIGVARARDIKNRRNLSLDTVKRMKSYFARHEVDKQGQGWSPGEDGYPSAGRIAWALWSGDPGRAWAEAIVAKIDDKKSSASLFISHLRTLSATSSEAAILPLFNDCIVAFNRMASNASFKFMRDEVLISSTLKVFSAWDSLKVSRIDAASIATKMIDMKPIGDLADDLLVRKSMSWDRLGAITFAADSKISVPTTVFCSSPIPAIALAKTLVDFYPEAFSDIIHKNLRFDSAQTVSQHETRGKSMDMTEEIVSAAQNIINRASVAANWNLGPDKASVDPTANAEYWQKLADVWQINEAEARRRLCANCEYFDNSAPMQRQMEDIPLDALDMDGGGRGYCVKFDFICHNLRVCQAWEPKEFEAEDDSEEKKVTGHIHHKSVALTLKKEPDQDGVFEGYASVFGVVDQGMDVVERGAFRKSLGSRKVKMLWQHDMAQPIGVWDEIYEDERGLFVRGRLLKEVAKGREAMALLRAGAIDSMSIGYRTMEAVPEGDGRVRKLTEVDLFEISLVTFPMLPDAKVTNVKSIRTERDFERFLRDAGYSRSEATAIALHGFKALPKQRDAGEDEAVTGELDALLSKLTKLKGVFNVR